MIIIHGDDYPNSRKFLNQLLSKVSSTNQEIIRLQAKEIDLTAIRQILDSPGLFSISKLIFTLPQSKFRKNLLSILSNHQQADLILYQPNLIKPSNLAYFPKASVSVFKPDPVIFKFLESLKPNNSRPSLSFYYRLNESYESDEYLLAMLVRQIRLLIQTKDAIDLPMPPWQAKKLRSQAALFSLSHLLRLHRLLYQADLSLKTGTVNLSTEDRLVNFLLNL